MDDGFWRRFVGYLAGFVALMLLAGAALVFGGGPAHAAGGRTPPPVGAGWVWGAPLASLPTDCNTISTAGGWDNGSQEHYSTGLPTVSTFEPMRYYVRLAEPCYRVEQANGVRIRLGGQMYAMPTATTPVTAQSSMTGAPGTSGIVAGDWYLRCATAEWSKTATIRTHNGTGGFSSSSPTAAESGTVRNITSNPAGAAAWGTAITDAQCAYLISATGKICGFASDGAAPWGSDPATCKTITWWAEDWYAERDYDYEEWDEDLCTFDMSASSDCVYTNPDNIDGTDFDEACQGAPTFTAPGWDAFGDWVPTLVAWWQAAIGHYGRCLFVPINGFDREAWVADAWENGVAGEVAQAASDAATAYQWGENCGALFSGNGYLDGLDINTCTWSWALPIKVVIGWGLTALAAFFLIGFVLRTIAGVLNKKVPTPLAGGDDS